MISIVTFEMIPTKKKNWIEITLKLRFYKNELVKFVYVEIGIKKEN